MRNVLDCLKALEQYGPESKLDPIFKDKWVEALKYGNLKQTKGDLHRRNHDTGTDSYCCLGVASVLVAGLKEETKSFSHAAIYSVHFPDGTLQAATPPAGWQNMHSKVIDALWHLNDDHNFTFGQIADQIQEYL